MLAPMRRLQKEALAKKQAVIPSLRLPGQVLRFTRGQA